MGIKLLGIFQNIYETPHWLLRNHFQNGGTCLFNFFEHIIAQFMYIYIYIYMNLFYLWPLVENIRCVLEKSVNLRTPKETTPEPDVLITMLYGKYVVDRCFLMKSQRKLRLLWNSVIVTFSPWSSIKQLCHKAIVLCPSFA